MFIFRCEQVSSFFWDKMSRSWIAQLYDSCMFSYLTNCQTIFQSGYIILNSHPQWMRVLIASHLQQILICQDLFICFNFSRFNRYIVIPHCSLNLFSQCLRMLRLFFYAYLPPVYILRWNVCLYLLHLFKIVICYCGVFPILLRVFFLTSLLEYNCFTMVC